MSNEREAQLDAWLKDWPVPEPGEEHWDDASSTIAERIASMELGQGDDTWLAAPLPAEPGEGGGAEPVKQVASEVRMSEPGPDKVKRKSLKDIAQRVSAAPPAPSSMNDAPPNSGPSPRASSPELARPSLVSRPPEARDSDSGILDLAAVRHSQASLPDSGAAPGTSDLFEDDKAPVAAAPIPIAQAQRKSSSLVPLLGGGVVAIAAIAAAFFVVMKRPAPSADMASPPPVVAMASAASESEPAGAPAATATTTAVGDLAMATAEVPGAPPTEGAGRAAGGPAEPAKATGKEDAPGATAKSDDTKKEPAGPAPTDLGGAMATAVGATTGQPGKDATKDQPPSPPSGSIPESPSQGAIQGALGSVMGSAKGCVAGMDEPSRATVVFGSSGRVKSVSVSGPASKTGAGGCIKSALSKASVGPFTRDSYSVGVTIRP